MSKKLIKLIVLILCLSFCLCLFPACQKSDPLAQNGFTSLRLNAKKGAVSATVTLDERTVQAHADEVAYLYELLPGETVSSLSDRAPLDEAKVKPSMKYSFNLTNGDRTRLYSTFAVGFEDGTFLSSTGHRIENPEALASDTDSFPWITSPKGLNTADADHTLELGAMHAMYELSFSAFANGSETFTFGGNSYTYSADVIADLDKQILAASNAGLQVSLTVTPDVIPSYSHATAYLDFLASRYAGGEHGKITAFFIGKSDGLTVADATLLCRLANQALRSHVANGRVYVVSSADTLTETKLFFANVQLALAECGSFDWGAAVEPTLTDTPWTVAEEESDAMSVQNLSALSSYLFSASHRGRASWFAVTGLVFSAENEDTQAAALAYSYRAATAAKATLIFCSAYMQDENGLYSADGTARRAASVFEAIDTGLSADDTRLCESIAGSAWTDLPTQKITRKTDTGSASLGLGAFVENALFDFSVGDTLGFTGVGSVTVPETRNSAAYSAPVLYTWLEPTYGNTAGVRKILSDASALDGAMSVSVRLLTQVPNAETVTARLRLDGTANDGTLLSYESEIEIANGSWQTVTFQISSFVADANLSRPCILTLTTTPDRETDEEYVLWVRGMDIRQPEQDHGILIPTLLILCGVLLGFLGVFILYHHSGKKKTARRRK